MAKELQHFEFGKIKRSQIKFAKRVAPRGARGVAKTGRAGG